MKIKIVIMILSQWIMNNSLCNMRTHAAAAVCVRVCVCVWVTHALTFQYRVDQSTETTRSGHSDGGAQYRQHNDRPQLRAFPFGEGDRLSRTLVMNFSRHDSYRRSHRMRFWMYLSRISELNSLLKSPGQSDSFSCWCDRRLVTFHSRYMELVFTDLVTSFKLVCIVSGTAAVLSVALFQAHFRTQNCPSGFSVDVVFVALIIAFVKIMQQTRTRPVIPQSFQSAPRYICLFFGYFLPLLWHLSQVSFRTRATLWWCTVFLHWFGSFLETEITFSKL